MDEIRGLCYMRHSRLYSKPIEKKGAVKSMKDTLGEFLKSL